MLKPWPGAPKMTSSCATRPGSRTECTCTPSGASRRGHRGAPRRSGIGRQRIAPGRTPRRRDHRRRVHRGARRRVTLLVVVQLNDLDPSMCGAAIRLRWTHAPMAKLGTTTRLAPVPLPEKSAAMAATSLFGQSARPNDGVDALVRIVRRVALTASAMVKSTTTSAPRSEEGIDLADDGTATGIGTDTARVDCSHQLQVGRLRHGPADLLAHAAAGADHTDPLHGLQATGRRGRPGGTRNLLRRRGQPRSACAAPPCQLRCDLHHVGPLDPVDAGQHFVHRTGPRRAAAWTCPGGSCGHPSPRRIGASRRAGSPWPPSAPVR